MPKLPSGNFRTRVEWKDETGKRHSKSFTAPTKREAKKLAEEFKGTINKKRSTLTVSEAVDRLIRINDSIYSPSTPRTYQKIKRNYMQDIANTKLMDLDDEIVQAWINKLSRQYSPKTVANAFGLLQTCATQFYDNATFHIRLPKRRKRDMEIPQPSDIALLLNATKDTPTHICVLLGAHCGLRRSEMSALTWKDIDFKNKKIKINKAVVQGDDNKWYTKPPKSYAGYRTLDMTEDIYNYFMKADKSKSPVIYNPNGITKHVRNACAELGMNYYPHILRHYFCSVCCNLGIPESITVKLMGHSDSTMVHQVYGHVLNEFEEQARNQITNYMNTKK